MKIWKIQTSTSFDKQLAAIDKKQKATIVAFLEKRIMVHPDPKVLAKPLHGSLKGYWRFRVGDYRIIVDIQEDICTIIALELGHRREIYS